MPSSRLSTTTIPAIPTAGTGGFVLDAGIRYRRVKRTNYLIEIDFPRSTANKKTHEKPPSSSQPTPLLTLRLYRHTTHS